MILQQFFKRFSTFWLILLPLLIPGVLVTVWRCVFRNLGEQRNVFVETVVDFEEIRQLAREESWSLPDLFAALKKNGASSVAVSEDTLASLESEGKITVLNSKEIRKLTIDESFQIEVPAGTNTLGSLWVHSESTELLDRIEQHLSWKVSAERLMRIHRNLLLINKSSIGFRERVGLGFSSEYFSQATEAGLGLVVRVFNYPGLSVENASRIINSIPSPASVSALLFAEEEMLGSRGQLKGIVDLFRNRSYRIGWVEFNLQDGIDTYLDGLAATRPFVRVHSIGRKELDLVYNTKRAVARWERAVKERSLKMLYIRCFFQDDKRFIENLVTFNLDYLKRIVGQLEASGFKIAGNTAERLNEPRHLVGKMTPFEILAIGLSLMLGIPLLLRVCLNEVLSEKLIIPCVLLTLGLFVLLPVKTFMALCGLVGAVSFSTVGVIAAMKGCENSEEKSFRAILPGFVLKMVLPSVFGGLLIAGLYSEIEYLLKFEQFRGIKLAFLLPLVITGLWSLRRFGRGVFGLMNKPVNPVGVFLLSAVAAGTLLYMLRSGNVTFLKPSELEDTFRTFLENILVARPRNKEFLVGYPAGLLFIFFFARKNLAILPILAIFMQMGQVSALNSLCHFHTPLLLSLLRIVNGLWLGVVVGLVVVLIVGVLRLLLIVGAEKKKNVMLVGYFGFGNIGDELLWQTFAQKFLQEFPMHRAVVLHRGGKMPDNTDRFAFVSRKNLLDVLEEIFCCEVMVIPGGGVLQSVTSARSLIYYLTVLSLGRLAGARILLPSQGLGPWTTGSLAKLSQKWLTHELKNVDYISLRDKDSADAYTLLTGNTAAIASDMVFLNDNIKRASVSGAKETLRVFAVLRFSVAGSARIAADLVNMAEEIENLELHPVAFQPEEDEKVWREAGWKGDVFYPDRPENVFAGADLVVSMRLHGCIIAANAGIPWIGIAYDPKVSAFASSCRWKFCCTVEEAERKYLEEKINLLAVKRAEFADKLNRSIGEKRRLAEADFAEMAARLK